MKRSTFTMMVLGLVIVLDLILAWMRHLPSNEQANARHFVLWPGLAVVVLLGKWAQKHVQPATWAWQAALWVIIVGSMWFNWHGIFANASTRCNPPAMTSRTQQ